MPTPEPTLIAKSVLLEDDAVRILDRRVFPFQQSYVECRTVEDVAVAIEQMVTQSSGPGFAAAAGMVLAARAAAGIASAEERSAAMESAAQRLQGTRRTNNFIREATSAILHDAQRAIRDGGDLVAAVTDAAEREGEDYRLRSTQLGRVTAELIPDGATILTHCWAESYITETVRAALESGKTVSAICTETRPYLQGARLTSHSLAEMGVPTRLVTDAMPAHLMARGEIDLFISAADRVSMDGHIVNKIGTFQIALAAHALDIPYVALVQAPDREAQTIDAVEMEDRDPDEVLYALGHRTASPLVSGIYPAFDITPPRYVSAVATARGRFSPYDLHAYYDSKEEMA